MNNLKRNIYVNNYGSNITCDGSYKKPFLTIRHAINISRNSDVIIDMKERYHGEGNVNINFIGKSIAVQSQYLDDDNCIQNTIIDANGYDFVARFVSDEVAEGKLIRFTISGGNINITSKGIPGLFGYSEKAKPIIRRIIIERRIEKEEKENKIVKKGNIQYYLPFDIGDFCDTSYPPVDFKRLWDEKNPFFQPFSTTDYYGSGDTDGNGDLSINYYTLAQEMANGINTSSYRKLQTVLDPTGDIFQYYAYSIP